jgi:hypothetical protein
VTEAVERHRYALLGVRPCDIAAIRIAEPLAVPDG